MTAPELKPCPWCKGTDVTIEGKGQIWRGVKGYSEPQYFELRHFGRLSEGDEFPRCHVVFRHRTEADAIAAWNTRAPDADLDAAVGAALAEAAKAAWPHDWQPDHILSRTNYMLFCAAKNILALRPTAITALDRAKREARVEVVAALQELTEVAERAIRLSREHSDFKLYGMEPMWQAIAAARALIEKEGKP